MRLSALKYILTLITLLITAKPGLAADSTSYIIRHYTDEDGLPQNSIRSINRDAEGFIWLTTEDGLVRFDGNSFFVYNNTNTSLSSNRFVDISVSIFDGNKYAVTIDTGDHVLIRNGTAIPAAWYERAEKKLLDSFQVHGTLYGADKQYFPVAKKSFYWIRKDSILFARQGRLQQFYLSRPEQTLWRFFLLNGQLCYLTPENKLLICDQHNGTPAIIKGDLAEIKKGDKITVQWNTADNPGFFHVNNSLYLATLTGNNTITVRKLIDKFPFAHTEIRSIYRDEATGTLFVGTSTNGLFVFYKKRFQTRSINNEAYYAQTSLHDSLIVTSSGHLFGKNIQQQNALYEIPGTINAYTMHTDKQGYIWVVNDHLLKLDPVKLTTVQKWATRDEIFLLHESRGNILWLGSREGNLYQLNMNSPKDTMILKGNFPRISYILEGGADTLWIGAYGALYCFHIKTGKTEKVGSFDGKYIRSLYSSHPGEVWISTYDDGFYLWMNGQLTHFPYDNDRYLNSVHCIIEDKKGFFWLTTNKGLFQIARADLLDYANHKIPGLFYMYYGKENGFNTNEFNGGCQPCAIRLKNGTLSLPSLNGLVWFNPDSLKMLLPGNDIFIDKMELEGKSIKVASKLYFSKHFDQLSIWTSTPYFGDRRNVHLYYRIVKKGKPVYWPMPANGIVTLQNLPSGDHIIEIIKTDGFGKNNYKVKRISLYIAPYWYQTWWFYTLSILLAIGLIYLFVNIRTRLLIRRNRWLEILIKKRTKKLEQTLNTLNASRLAQSRQAYIQQRLIAAISHDIRTPMKYLSASNKRIYDGLKKITDDEDLLEMGRNASDSAGRMQQYLSNLLQYVKTTSYGQEVEKEYFNLNHLAQQQATMFRQIVTHNNTTININVHAGQMVYSNMQLLSIILHNLMDNAVKHTIGGVITISSQHTEEQTVIMIKDNGGGVSADIQEWANKANVYSQTGYERNTFRGPDGIGLFIVKELIQLIGATFLMQSDHMTSTEIQIMLPNPQPAE